MKQNQDTTSGLGEHSLILGNPDYLIHYFSNIKIDCFDTYEADEARVKKWIVAVRHNLYHHSRRRSKWLKWLVMSVVLRLPWRLAASATLMLNGANLILQAEK